MRQSAQLRGGAWRDLGFFLLAALLLLLGMGGAIALSVEGVTALALALAVGGFVGCIACVARLAVRQAASRALIEALDQAAAQPFSGDRLEANFGALRAFVVVGMCLFCIAAGAFCLLVAWSAPAKSWLLFPVAALATFGAAFVAWATLRMALRRPCLRLDRNGLDHAHLGSVEWRNVIGLRLFVTKARSREYAFLQLGLADASGARRTGLARFLLPRKSDWSIPLTGLDCPPERVHEAAQGLRKRVDPPPIEHWQPGLTRDELELMRVRANTLAELERLGQSPIDAVSVDSVERLMLDQDARVAQLMPRVEAARRSRHHRVWAFFWAGIVLMLLYAATQLARLW